MFSREPIILSFIPANLWDAEPDEGIGAEFVSLPFPLYEVGDNGSSSEGTLRTVA